MRAEARTSRHFDVVVVGAGPAGSAAAVSAARAGLSVALVDKARFPRHKLCGGAFSGRAVASHRRAFGTDLPAAPHLTKNAITFGAFGVDLGRYDDIPPLYLTMRESLDLSLFEAALDAGAQDFSGHLPQGIDLSGKQRVLSLGEISLAADVVIGCDGVSSAIARALYGRPFDPKEIGFALEVELPEQQTPPELRIDFGAANWGYGWVFPKTCGTTIGIGGIRARNPDLKARLATYLAERGVEGRPSVKGQYLPFGAPRRIPGRDSVLLAGDAAGLVDPITGEGIGHALESGRLAAEAAIAALSEGDPKRALPLYRRKLAPIHRSMQHARLIRPLLFQPRFQSAFIAGFRRSRSLKYEYLRLLAGETEYADISRQLARRLPHHLWRAFMKNGPKRQETEPKTP